MLKRVMRLDVLVVCFYMHARRVVSRFDAKAGQELGSIGHVVQKLFHSK